MTTTKKKIPCQLCGKEVKAENINKLKNHRNNRSIKVCPLCTRDLTKAKLISME